MNDFKILVVDDSRDSLSILLRMLKKAGYRDVRSAESGELALEAVAAGKPDLILLDIRMAGIDGLEVCRRLKKNPNTSDIPVIFISGASDSEERLEGLSAGAVDYVIKPFDLEELAARVKIHLEMHDMKRMLAQEKDKIHAILSSSPVGMIVFNRELRIVYANPAAEALFSNKIQGPDSSCCGDFILCENRNKDPRGCGYSPDCATCPIIRSVREILNSNADQIEHDGEACLHVDGREIPLYARFKAKAFLLEGKRSVLLSIEDITELNIADEAARADKERHRTILKTAMDGFWMVDMEGRLLEVNETYCRMSGYSEQELLTMRVSDLEVIETADDVSARIQKMIAQDELRFESRHRRRDGSVYDIELSLQYRPAEGGRIVAFMRDISDRKKADEALRESEARYRTLFEYAPDGIVIADNRSYYLDANASICRMLGYTRDELIGLHASDIIVPSEVQHIGTALNEINAKSDYHREWQFRRKDGSVFTAEVCATTMPDGKLLGIIRDITERKLAEEATKQEHSLNNAIIDSIPGTFYMLDEAGRYVRWNAYQRDEIVGKPEELLASTNAIDTIHPDDRTFIQSRIRNVLTNNAIEIVEGRVLLRGGPEFRWLLMTGRQMIIDGHPFLVGIGIDITERKRVEEELLQAKNEWENTFNTISDMVTIHDKDFNIIQANKPAKDMLGLSSLQGLGLGVKCFKFFHGAGSPPAGCPSCNCLITGKPTSFEIFEPHLNMYLEVRAIPRMDNQGGLIGLIHVVRDITGRKQAEAENTRLESQLRQAQKLEAVGTLAGGVAHDFNNMLSVINGYSDMLLNEMSSSDPKYECIKEIFKAGTRSAELTQQLLAFARKQTIAPKVLDLNDTVTGMLKMLQRLIGENIELVWKPASNLWKVKMDPSQINQILANLLVNARDAISGAGRIAIETAKTELDEEFCEIHPDTAPGKYVILEVGDSGHGMDKETLEHIFEPFFTTKKVGAGTGLGLATVFGIVKQNKGFIDVCSEPGKGTTFKIYLPRHEDVKDNGGKNVRDESAKVYTGIETILLVEDEISLLRLAERRLEHLGYTVLAADNPAKAIKLAKEYGKDIHLLMTDVIL